MGSFFGLSDAGRESQGFPREYGAYSKDQMKQWLGRMNKYGDLGDYYTQQGADYWTQRMNEGYASPDDIRNTGRKISPWVDDYVKNEQGRRDSIRDLEAGRRSAEDVGGEMSGRLDELGQSVGRTSDAVGSEILDTAKRQMGREDAAHSDIVNNIKGSSNSMRTAVNNEFAGMRADNAKTYGGIKDAGKKSFADQAAELALIMPGSQMQQARVGRSFAPQMSDTLMRLRRAGIDPNSPEAAAVLREVETSRSRAMDDAAADGTLSYVDRKNDLSSRELGFNTAADRERLGNETSLATGQLDRSNAITGAEGDAFNSEVVRNSGTMNSIDRDRSQRSTDNTNTTFDRGRDVLMQRNNLSDWTRNAGMQDVDRKVSNIEGDSDSELKRGATLDNQYAQGNAWQQNNQATKDNAAGQIGQIGGRYQNNMFQSANTAQGFGDRAMNAYGTAYSYEAPKAGWGAKLLGGIGAAAMDYYAPGSGQLLRGAMGSTGNFGTSEPYVSSGGGGSWGGGTASTYGGGWGGSTNPYVFSMAAQQQTPNPIASLLGRSKNYAYDPAKTKTLSNGDVQVGRY